MHHLKHVALIAASAMTISAMQATAQSTDVGVLAAVNKDVVGERPREQPRQLVLREKLILDERITTSDVGGGQVMFLDQTTLTLSPNSNILLDRYVYDPSAQIGDVSVTLLKGAMRFVGGRITKTGVATIKTPSATIGIRGGIGHIAVDEDGGTNYLHIAGISSTISNSAGTVVVTREGGSVTVPPPAAGDGGGVAPAGPLATETGAGTAPQALNQPPSQQPQGQSETPSQQPQGQSEQPSQQLQGQSEPPSQQLQGQSEPPSQQPQGQSQARGPAGGPPQYTGVATPDMIEIALGDEGGVGDGGLETPITAEIVRPGVEQIAFEVSAGDGARIRPPISTQGEQQEETFNAPPLDLGEPPEEEIADKNIAEDIAVEIPQLLDGLEFRGEWTALAGLSNGDFIEPTAGLKFQMEYSLTDGQGVILVELPDTGDLAAPNLTTLDGDQVRGDQFIIRGDEDLNLIGEGTLSRLGADATDTLIEIGQNNSASGAIFLDYTGSDLTNTDFIDGELNGVPGTAVAGDPISTQTNSLRLEFEQ